MRDQIGVAAALADAVQRALDLAHAGLDGGQRIGDRLAGVVMGMDAEMLARHAGGDHARATMSRISDGCVPPLVSQSTTQRAPASIGRLGAGERIVGIGLVAVEEMLAIDHRLLAGGDRRLDGVADAVEVFLVGAAERDVDMVVPALGDKADGIGLRAASSAASPDRWRPKRRPAWSCRRRRSRRVSVRFFGEEGGVGRVGAGIAALDIVDAEFVEHAGQWRSCPRPRSRCRASAGRRAMSCRRDRVFPCSSFPCLRFGQAWRRPAVHRRPAGFAGGQTPVSWSGCWKERSSAR